MFTLNSDISQFWNLETLNITDPVDHKSRQELHEMTLEHFRETVSRNKEGRYEVSLPWIEDKNILPDNFQIASKRCKSTVEKTRQSGCSTMKYFRIGRKKGL